MSVWYYVKWTDRRTDEQGSLRVGGQASVETNKLVFTAGSLGEGKDNLPTTLVL